MSSIAVLDRVEHLDSLRVGPEEPLSAEVFRLTDPFRHVVLQDVAGGKIYWTDRGRKRSSGPTSTALASICTAYMPENSRRPGGCCC